MKADKHSHHHSSLATAVCIGNISGNHNHFTPLGKQSQGRERRRFDPEGPFVVNDVKEDVFLLKGQTQKLARTEEIEFHYSRMNGNSPDFISIIRVVP